MNIVCRKEKKKEKKKERKKEKRDGYVPSQVKPRPDLFPIAMFSCVLSKEAGIVNVSKQSMYVALYAESNNANIADLFNIFDARSLGIRPYFWFARY